MFAESDGHAWPIIECVGLPPCQLWCTMVRAALARAGRALLSHLPSRMILLQQHNFVVDLNYNPNSSVDKLLASLPRSKVVYHMALELLIDRNAYGPQFIASALTDISRSQEKENGPLLINARHVRSWQKRNYSYIKQQRQCLVPLTKIIPPQEEPKQEKSKQKTQNKQVVAQSPDSKLLYKMEEDLVAGTAAFTDLVVESTESGLSEKLLDPEEVLRLLGLDPRTWSLVSLNTSVGERWVRDHPDEAAVTRRLRSYAGKAIKKELIPDLITPPASAEISILSRKPQWNVLPGSWKTAFVFPDQQIGMRWNDYSGKDNEPSYQEIHDTRAMTIAHEIFESVNPDIVVNLGDFLDLAPLSKYATEPQLLRTTQLAINAGFEELQYQRHVMGNKPIILLKGNHDKRFEDSVKNGLPEIYGLQLPGSDSTMFSIRYLLRMEELKIQYIDAYPGEHGDGAFWLETETLKFQHAPNKLNSSGSSAPLQAAEGPYSTVYGHCHRMELAFNHAKTAGPGGLQQVFAASPGTLAKIDGSCPGYSTSLKASGSPATSYNNWQQGVMLIHYHPNRKYSERPELIQIKDETAVCNGHIFGNGHTYGS